MWGCPDDTTLRGRIGTAVVNWIDCHPRVGWYLVVLSMLNLLLNALDLFK